MARTPARPGAGPALHHISPAGQAALAWAVRHELPILALWGALAAGLAAITTRVTDWFVMTNELLYERRAISAAQSLSPVTRLRGDVVQSFDQLYPLLIAPVFRHGYVPHDLVQAHFLNAWIMSSACIPAFLLARRATERPWAAYLVALLSVTVPWILYSAFLLTEVAAYPAFLWGVFAVQRATAAPSARTDVLALLAIALAFFARTQFAILAVVLPLAILAHEVGRAPGSGARERVWGGFRAAVRAHRALAGLYAVALVAGILLAAAGRLASALGVYGDTISGSILPGGTGRWFLEHMASIAVGFGLLPFVVGVAWLLANLVRPSQSKELHAFACVASLAVAFVMLQVTIFDIRFGGGFVHDRYLFYVVPLVTLGFVCALLDRRRPRWSLVVPTGLVAAGCMLTHFATYRIVNSDTPVSVLNDFILSTSHGLSNAQAALAAATVLLAGLFVLAVSFLRHRRLTVLFVALLLLALPAETGYGFARLFRVNGWSGRPLTQGYGESFDWIDKLVGTKGSVTMISYPTVPGDFWQSFPYWRDVEFWNKSVVRAAYYPYGGIFESTGNTFPKLYLQFNQSTGASNFSPTVFAAQAEKESRFRIDGPVRVNTQGVLLIDAGKVWRTDWLTYGLTDDGWTKPGVTARLRIFGAHGQSGPRIRYVTFQIWAPSNVTRRPFELVSNLQTTRDAATNAATVFARVQVCVPARGYSEVRIRTPDHSPIYGDMRDRVSFEMPREGGIFLAEIAMADEIGPPCRPGTRHG